MVGAESQVQKVEAGPNIFPNALVPSRRARAHAVCPTTPRMTPSAGPKHFYIHGLPSRLPYHCTSLFPPSRSLLHPPIMSTVHLLDYVAGNVRSLVNAIEKVGYTVEWVKSPADVPKAHV